jgi:hypothetical protein
MSTAKPGSFRQRSTSYTSRLVPTGKRQARVGSLSGIPIHQIVAPSPPSIAWFAAIRKLERTDLLLGFLFGLEPRDPRADAVAMITLPAAAIVAAALPARRAARVNPIEALRQE